MKAVKDKMKRKEMRVECGSLRWKGKALAVDHAIVSALSTLPETAAPLMRIHDGRMWQYIALSAALKIAGYSNFEIKERLARE